MDLRAEATSDWPAVRAVHLAAFGDHGDVVGNLVDDLRESVARGDGLSIVAEDGNDVVGRHVHPEPAGRPKRLVAVQVLSPIGVLPAHPRQGIGTKLIRRGLELVVERDVPLVFLDAS